MRPARPNRRYRIALAIDRSLGPVLCALLFAVKRWLRRAQPPLAPEAVRKVLVLKFWGMGSIVLATPLLREIAARHPDARIDFVTLRENDAILDTLPEVEGHLLLDLGRGVPRFLLGTLGLLRRIRRERYDLLLDLEFFTRYSAIFSVLARARRSHGFSSKGSARGRLHDVEVPFNVYAHVALNFLTLLHGEPLEPLPILEPASELMLPPLAAPAAARARCDAELASDPAWHPGRPLVVVNPNTGDMALERRWPADRVAELLATLAARGGVNLAVTGAPSERGYVESVVAASGAAERVIQLAGRLDVAGLVALFERAAVVVTNDSGPLHIACAAGASTVALFGPETPTLYGPLHSRPGQRHHVHYLRLACSPCMFVHDNKVPSCWFARARCVTDIQPGDVLQSVEKLLADPAAARPAGAPRTESA